MGLRERAVEAWIKEEKDQKDAQERTDVGLFRRARGHFFETFGVEPEVVEHTSEGIEVGASGMVFLFNVMTKAYWLWGECPDCGWHCWSPHSFKTLGELGKIIADFKPGGHECGTQEVEKETTAETLRKVLREFLEE